MKFLIIGCGSMGKRRARCLRKLGFENIAAVDPRADRREGIAQESGVAAFDDFDAAIAEGADAALVCVAPHLHTQYLHRCIAERIPAFCEAPLTLSLDEADAVIDAAEAAGVFLAPSCTYLHHAHHRAIKEILDSQRLGAPLAALSYVGQHVADWHPYEDYRGFYASKRSEGGMCFDMIPHDLHLFTEYFGDVQALSCMARRRASDIDTDAAACDAYDVLFDMESGVTLTLHQDMFQRPWGNHRKIMCERGAIEWNWSELRICEYFGPGFLAAPKWQDLTDKNGGFEDMYVSEIQHMLHALDGLEPYLMPLRRERRILEITLACEESSREGRQINFV